MMEVSFTAKLYVYTRCHGGAPSGGLVYDDLHSQDFLGLWEWIMLDFIQLCRQLVAPCIIHCRVVYHVCFFCWLLCLMFAGELEKQHGVKTTPAKTNGSQLDFQPKQESPIGEWYIPAVSQPCPSSWSVSFPQSSCSPIFCRPQWPPSVLVCMSIFFIPDSFSLSDIGRVSNQLFPFLI